jgi:predicted ThiF/HesA family dinucleotide-utilizing enzyme
MRGLLFIAAVTALSGCEIASQTADELARQQAKSVVNGVVAEKLPGVNAAPVTDCIIDNATAREIVTIAGAAVTGVTPATGRLVLEIARRPDTVTCIASNGFGLLRL